MKPKAQTAEEKAAKAAARAKQRAKAQVKRRAKERLAEAETYEEALARLREAFDVEASEATSPASPPPPQDSPAQLAPAPSENASSATSQTSTEPATAAKPASPDDAKPNAAQSEADPATEGAQASTTPPIQTEREPEPEFEFQVDWGELAEAAVEVADDELPKHLGPKAKLNDSKKARLVKALKPAIVEWLGGAGKAAKATPTEALIATAAIIYGPALLDRFVFNTPTASTAALADVVSITRKAAP